MDKIHKIEQAFTEWSFPARYGYSLVKKERISEFEAGHRNYLGINYNSKNRKLNFSFFEFFKEEPINRFSLLVECLDCGYEVLFKTFSIDEYFRKKNVPDKMHRLSLNDYPGMSTDEQVQSVFQFFEQELSNEELLSMLKGEKWLDQYYYSIR